MILLGGGLILVYLTGMTSLSWLAAFYTALVEAAVTGVIVAAAGGFGWVAIRKIAPRSAPRGLKVVTACGLGLWFISVAVLAVGSFSHGLLKNWVWWPVIAFGLLLAGWFGHGKTDQSKSPSRSDGRVLIWVLIAIAAGLALAGATHPPGWWRGFTDEYDVLEYHLQVPREFYEAQHIGQLTHNVYSYYPMGVEMLYLLAMILRGGAYEGMYLAKFIHLAFGALAVAAIFCGLKRHDHARGRFAVGLLATTPFVIYLSWIAMVELAQLCYAAIALLWVREWIEERSVRSAVCAGLALGASCAVKYLSVGLLAGPVLLAMLLISFKRIRTMWHLTPAILAAGLLFSPWIIRNVVYTDNPIFPLGTTIFGRAHWSAQSQQRWIDGHGAAHKPPVPPPPGYEAPNVPGKAERFVTNFLGEEKFGHITMVLAVLGICVWIARSGPTDLFGGALIATLACQLGVWVGFTHGMPARFLAPAVVPMVLLAAGVLADFSRVRSNPLHHGESDSPRGPWGLAPAVVAFAAAAAVNLLICVGLYKLATHELPPGYGIPGDVARKMFVPPESHNLPAPSRLLLVGEGKGFYFPPGTVYATAFDAHPLGELIESGAPPSWIIEQLARRGITHIWVDWGEMARLARTYGYPAALVSDLFERLKAGGPVGTSGLDRLGLTLYKHLRPEVPPTTAPAAASAPATAPPPPTQPTTAPQTWPYVTIYALSAVEPGETTTPLPHERR